MPLYLYRCEVCNETFDFLAGVGTGDEKPKCPRCKSTNVQKLLSTFGVRTGSSSGSSSCPTGTCSLSGGD